MNYAIRSHIRQSIGPMLIAGLATGAFNYFVIQAHYLSFLYGVITGVIIFVSIFSYATFVNNKLMRNLPIYTELILNTLIIVFIILFWVTLILMLINVNDSGEIIPYLKWFLGSKGLHYGLFYGVLISFIFNLIISIQEIVGAKTLGKLFIGAYSQPREEERIFMFIDLKSSTAIAEQIGNKQFLNLLNDFFFHASKAISETKGSIYKYVGDEVIVTWSMNKGLKNANCIDCFFRIQQSIADNQEIFQKRYGLIPAFKAGLHGGKVIAGELGFRKKEITYLGDVLNTTARIEGECNAYQSSLLASENLIKMLELPARYRAASVGRISLRGKGEAMELYDIKQTT